MEKYDQRTTHEDSRAVASCADPRPSRYRDYREGKHPRPEPQTSNSQEYGEFLKGHAEGDRKRAKSADTDEASEYTELRQREKKSGNPWNNTRSHANPYQKRQLEDDPIEASPASTEAAEGQEPEPPWGRKLGAVLRHWGTEHLPRNSQGYATIEAVAAIVRVTPEDILTAARTSRKWGQARFETAFIEGIPHIRAAWGKHTTTSTKPAPRTGRAANPPTTRKLTNTIERVKACVNAMPTERQFTTNG